MKVSVYVKQKDADQYDNLGSKNFSFLPRENEFISAEVAGEKKYFQVIAVHHVMKPEPAIELYAVQSEPSWELKKRRGIGFGT
jgi:alpha-acetolactate decarboxylase